MSVYFITAREIGRVKIGCANDPWDRFNTIATSSPVELSLEALFDGSYDVEREYHVRFAQHRTQGEWFHLTDEIEALIASVPTPEKPERSYKSGKRRKANEVWESRLKRFERENEELVQKSIKVSREMLADTMRLFAAMDAEREQLELGVDAPARRRAA